jgi:2-iminoacetate synthase
MRHILVLTGESRHGASPEYIAQSLEIISEEFSSVSIEMYPMTEQEYCSMVQSGADGFTMYQEAYDKNVYVALHEGGPKQDYDFRLTAPDRAAQAGMRTITIGPLLGLADPAREVFFSGLHAKYLQKQYPSVDVAISFPRLRPMAGEFNPGFVVNDKQFVQILIAARLFLPQSGITVSTRESKQFRNAIANIGVTKMSAGVSTAVGGHANNDPSTTQFEIADQRSLQEMKDDLARLGFQAVMYDWNSKFFKET